MSIFALRTARAGLSLARPLASTVSRVMASRVASSSTGLLSTRLFSVSASTSHPTATEKKPAAKKTATKKKPAAKKPAAKKPAAKKKVAAKKPAPKRKVAPKKTYTPEQLKKRKLAAKLKKLTPEQLKEHKAKAALKQKKDELKAIPPPPKRTPGAYALFIQSTYEKENIVLQPGQTLGEISATISNAFKALPESERQEYIRRSEQLKQERVKAYDQWAHSVGVEAIRKLNRDLVARGKLKLAIPDDLKRTRPPTSFFAFIAEKRKTGEISTDLRPAEQGKRGGELWRQLTPAEKAAYKS